MRCSTTSKQATSRGVRAADHGVRLQLVHLHRGRPGRHEPPADGAQRADRPAALHRPHRPAVHHQGVRARGRRRHRQRLPPGRLPLHRRQLPRPAPLRLLPRARRASSASTRGASRSPGSRPPRGSKWREVVNEATARVRALGPFDVPRYPASAWPGEARDEGAPGTAAQAARRRHREGRHRLRGGAARRPAGLRHRPGRRRRGSSSTSAACTTSPPTSRPRRDARRQARQARGGGQGLRRQGGRRARSARRSSSARTSSLIGVRCGGVVRRPGLARGALAPTPSPTAAPAATRASRTSPTTSSASCRRRRPPRAARDARIAELEAMAPDGALGLLAGGARALRALPRLPRGLPDVLLRALRRRQDASRSGSSARRTRAATSPGTLTRALHLAGRCVDCGECERACPVGHPARRCSTARSRRSSRERFGHRPDRRSRPCPRPIGAFRLDDAQEFIL